MRQLYHSAPHVTFDLTECKLHRLVDKEGKARFVICYPKAWEPTELAVMGGTVVMRPYIVTEWEEVEWQRVEWEPAMNPVDDAEFGMKP